MNNTPCDHITHQLLNEARYTNSQLFAIIDGAVNPKIHTLIKQHIAKPDFSNLFYQTPFDEIEDAAPYLIRLTPENSKLINKVWPYQWGYFLVAHAEQEEIEAHLRHILFVEDPLGEELLFRYYDPRVLPQFLESTNEEERRQFFGPIDEIHAFTHDKTELIKYTLLDG